MRKNGGRGVLVIMHGRSRMITDPRIPTVPGRSRGGVYSFFARLSGLRRRRRRRRRRRGGGRGFGRGHGGRGRNGRRRGTRLSRCGKNPNQFTRRVVLVLGARLPSDTRRPWGRVKAGDGGGGRRSRKFTTVRTYVRTRVNARAARVTTTANKIATGKGIY